MDTDLFAKALAGLFAIMNPFVALPMFLALTSDYAQQEQRKAGIRVALYTLALSGVVLVAGTQVLGFFGINVNDFRIAGGIVLLTIGLSMLNGTGSSAHQGTPAEQQHHAERVSAQRATGQPAPVQPPTSGPAPAQVSPASAAMEQAPRTDVAFYPMAFPIIAGPGAITTVVLLGGQAGDTAGHLAVTVALLLIIAMLGIVLFFAANIGHYLSQTLRTVMTRLMGMILAAIAVQMIVAGLGAVFPVLTR